MRSTYTSRVGVALASLLLLLGGSLRPAQAALTVTALSLRVNGVIQPCGSTVMGGDTVCVRFSSNQNANATVSVMKGSTTTLVASGSVMANTVYRVCVTAGSDAGTRTWIITVQTTTETNTDSHCTYVVGTTPPPTTLSGSVRTQNGCGVTFFNGNTVNIIVNSNMTAHAHVTLTKPDGTIVLFDGTVSAGDTTVATGTAGAPFGMRTLNLTLTAGTMTFNAPPCTYNVTASTLAPGGGG